MFKFTLSIVLLLLSCMSCATSNPSAVVAEEEAYEFFNSEYYEKWFEALRTELYGNDDLYGEKHNRVLAIVDPTFDDVTLIGIEHLPERIVELTRSSTLTLQSETKVTFATLSSSSINEGKLIEPWHDVVRHRRVTKDWYERGLSKVEFNQVFKQTLSSKIMDAAPVLPENGCTDGTRAFIEIVERERRQLISRHDCDPDYREVLSTVMPMVKLAAEKLSPAKAVILEMWATEVAAEMNTTD